MDNETNNFNFFSKKQVFVRKLHEHQKCQEFHLHLVIFFPLSTFLSSFPVIPPLLSTSQRILYSPLFHGLLLLQCLLKYSHTILRNLIMNTRLTYFKQYYTSLSSNLPVMFNAVAFFTVCFLKNTFCTNPNTSKDIESILIVQLYYEDYRIAYKIYMLAKAMFCIYLKFLF